MPPAVTPSAVSGRHDSEGIVFEAACGSFENAEEGYELHVRGRTLHELRRVAAAWRNCVPRSSPSSSSGLSSKGGLPWPSVGSLAARVSGRKREQCGEVIQSQRQLEILRRSLLSWSRQQK